MAGQTPSLSSRVGFPILPPVQPQTTEALMMMNVCVAFFRTTGWLRGRGRG